MGGVISSKGLGAWGRQVSGLYKLLAEWDAIRRRNLFHWERCLDRNGYGLRSQVINKRCLQDGRTPLHMASQSGREAMVERLITGGVNLELKDSVSYPSPMLFKYAILI